MGFVTLVGEGEYIIYTALACSRGGTRRLGPGNQRYAPQEGKSGILSSYPGHWGEERTAHVLRWGIFGMQWPGMPETTYIAFEIPLAT